MTGTYKPQIHTHYLPHLSLSFARHTISLNTTFLLLSADYSKSLHLQADRSLEFHTPSGCHYTSRLPRYGRDLKYNPFNAEALIPAVGVNENGSGEVFRLNLEAGRHMRAYEVDVGGDDMASTGGGALQGGVSTGSVNTAAVAQESHSLLAFGTSLGTVEFWDPRSRSRIGILQSPSRLDMIDGRQEVTALEFDRSGLSIATGSSAGLIHLYDLRSPIPVLKKDQGYGYPIQDIIYLTSTTATRAQTASPKILSSDKRIIKIWDAQNGSPWTSVEPTVDINSVAWCKDSGMLLTANEGRQQHSFFIPQLGPAPKWCSFLDNLVEEMAEDPNDPNAFTSQKVGEVYDNYKFLTTAQLESLNLSQLIGTTSLLRPYMHGYFVAQRLYEEAKLIADPFVWEEQRNKRVKEKIDAERESRIRGNKKVTAKVNKRLAEKMLERQEREERRQARRVLERGGDDAAVEEKDASTAGAAEEEKNTKPAGDLLSDPRFSALFQDENFAIDERSHEFKSLNPSTKPIPLTHTKGPKRTLTAVEEEEEALVPLPHSSSSSSSHSDSDSSSPSSNSKPKPNPKKADKRDTRISTSSYRRSGHRTQQPQPQQMRVTSSRPAHKTKDRSFGSRAERAKPAGRKGGGVVGERVVTFAPVWGGRGGKGEGKEREKVGKGERRGKERRSASGNVLRGL